MRLIYLDTALATHVGHHANNCRLITSELKSRGATVSVFASKEITPELRTELVATPLFRWSTYKQLHVLRDPISGWLRDFDLGWRTTLEDLRQITGLQPGDMVYFNSVRPEQLMATVQWTWQTPPAQRPRMVIEFGTDPGLTSITTGRGQRHFEVPDPRRDARAMLYHHIATLLQPEDRAQLKLVTFDRTVSAVYEGLLGCPVATLPLPLMASRAPRSRAGKRPITIAVLGHQRPDKGYQLVPEIVQGLIDLTDVEFLIHNAAPAEMRTPQGALVDLARGNSRIHIDDQPAAGPRWAALLDAADLVLCPYDPGIYASAYSAVLAECVANAIPTVIPAGTSLAAMSADFGGTGTEFSQWTAGAIATAVREALGQFDSLADRAMTAAKRWPTIHGPARFADALLAK